MIGNSLNKKKTHINIDELLAKVQDMGIRKTIASSLGDQNPGFMSFRVKQNTMDSLIIDYLFDICNCYDLDNQIRDNQQRFNQIHGGAYDKFILGGAYNAIMPCKNTYFHSAIASDLTASTLILLKYIDDVAIKHKKKLEDLVPFDCMDCYSGDGGGNYTSKNFLMLAIAKKYDTNISYTETMVGKQYVYRAPKVGYKDKYQKNDAELIKWLIKKAPDSCIKQKDSEGYNLVDYAIMKMDNDILKQLLERDKTLISGSELLKKYSDLAQFNYSMACDMVKKRYQCPLGIACEGEWSAQKYEVIKTVVKALSKVAQVNGGVNNNSNLIGLQSNSGYRGNGNKRCIVF